MSSSISESKHTLSSNKTHPRPIADECNATCDGHLYRDGRADGPTVSSLVWWWFHCRTRLQSPAAETRGAAV